MCGWRMVQAPARTPLGIPAAPCDGLVAGHHLVAPSIWSFPNAVGDEAAGLADQEEPAAMSQGFSLAPSSRRTGRRPHRPGRARPSHAAEPALCCMHGAISLEVSGDGRLRPRWGSRWRTTASRSSGRRRACGGRSGRRPCRARRRTFVLDRIVDDARDDLAFALERDRNREVRNAVQEVRGAVERVDDPAVRRWSRPSTRPPSSSTKP